MYIFSICCIYVKHCDTLRHLPFFCRYLPGDVVMIKPQNVDRKVDEFFDLLKWSGETLISIEQIKEGKVFICFPKEMIIT